MSPHRTPNVSHIRKFSNTVLLSRGKMSKCHLKSIGESGSHSKLLPLLLLFVFVFFYLICLLAMCATTPISPHQYYWQCIKRTEKMSRIQSGVCAAVENKKRNKTGEKNHLKSTIRNGKMRDKKQNSASQPPVSPGKSPNARREWMCVRSCERE